MHMEKPKQDLEGNELVFSEYEEENDMDEDISDEIENDIDLAFTDDLPEDDLRHLESVFLLAIINHRMNALVQERHDFPNRNMNETALRVAQVISAINERISSIRDPQ